MFRYLLIGLAVSSLLILGLLTFIFFFIVIDDDDFVVVPKLDEQGSGLTSNIEPKQTDTQTELIEVNNLWFEQLEKVLEITKQVINPAGLNQLASVGSLEGYPTLTKAGIIAGSNLKRLEFGLPVLIENINLNNIAIKRLNDIVAFQSFSHLTPSGVDVSQVADQFGYNYLVIGENLALGGFRDDQAIVNAWLNSPAHRDNLLSRRYQEIGVAVEEVQFLGRQARLSVLVLATPIDVCAEPKVQITNDILLKKQQLEKLNSNLISLEKDLNNTPTNDMATRRILIRDYNRLAIEHNSLLTQVKTIIVNYNQTVINFNNCLKAISF